MPIDPADLVASIATLGRLEFDSGLARSLRQLVDAGRELLDMEGVELMLVDGNGQLRRASSSNQRTEIIDGHQDRATLDLCAAALAKRIPISVREVHQDPDGFGSRAAPNDARVVVALIVPVELDGDPIGTLKVHSAALRDWDDRAVSAVQAYAGIVARLLAATAAAHVQEKQAAQLQTALDHRAVIQQAKGMLMAKEGIDAAAAFERLRTAARSSRRRIVDVAHELVAGRPLPEPRPPRLADRAARDRVAQAPASME